MITNAGVYKDRLASLDDGSGVFTNTMGKFGEITNVPRPSGKEKLIAQYLTKWAETNEFKYDVDKKGNVYVHVPASCGELKDAPAVVLQAHMDMVAEGNADTATKAEYYEESDGGLWMRSEGNATTLGADNGMGMAMMMALAEDKNLKHGPMTLVFTKEEETGLNGAKELDAAFLPKNAKYLFNLDMEDGAKYICNGCAGGERVAGKIDLVDQHEVLNPSEYVWMDIDVSNLPGGHSGVERDKHRGNAVQIINEYLLRLVGKFKGIKLIEMKGGTKDNSIPVSAFAKLALPVSEAGNILKFFHTFKESFPLEDMGIDIDPKFASEVKVDSKLVPTGSIAAIADRTRDSIFKAVKDVCRLKMERADTEDAPLIVSTHLGVVSMGANDGSKEFTIVTLPRAARPEDLDRKVDEITTIFKNAGLKVEENGRYDGWLEPSDSPAVKLAEKAIKEVVGEDAVVGTIHAGLETGVVRSAGAKADIKMSGVSAGPKMSDVHTRFEKLNVEDTAKVVSVVRRMVELAFAE